MNKYLFSLILISAGFCLYLVLRPAKADHEELAPETLPIITK